MATKALCGMWADPRTGIYYLRKRIPARYRSVASVSGRRIAGHIIKMTTGTADRKEAARRWPGVLASYAELEAQWERALNAVDVTPARASELAGLWIERVGRSLTSDGDPAEIFHRHLFSSDDADPTSEIVAQAQVAADLAKIMVSENSWPILLAAMAEPVRAARYEADARFLQANRDRDASPLDRVAANLPTPEPARSGASSKNTPPAISLTGLYEGWKAAAVVKARTIEETRYAVDLLKSHLGHDDAARVDAATLRAWRDSMLADGRLNNTWNNRLSMLGAVFAWGVSEGRLPANPALGLRLRKNRVQSPRPYSDEEAALILDAARAEKRPSLRWAHWVMAFTGMRAGEVLQLTGRDIRREGEIWFISVNEDAPAKSVKTGQPRNVPLHPALIAEGFLAYAQSIEGDNPLFPDKQLDKHGNRGGRAWNVIGKWVRQKVGISDPMKAPDHSWRHRMEDMLRDAEVPEDARDAITGHARKTTGRQYGVRGESLRRLQRHIFNLPIPKGVTIVGYSRDPS